jgi:hypothetical protein
LLAALKADDDAALIAIFGDKNKDLSSRPDKAANTANRAKIAGAMQQLRVLDSAADRRIVLIGDQAWPLPIPLVSDKGAWRFATEEGADELINRRIGGNERNAITVLRAYVDAQRQYASRDRDGDERAAVRRRSSAARPGSRTACTGRTTPRRTASAVRSVPLVAESAAYLKGHKESDP